MEVGDWVRATVIGTPGFGVLLDSADGVYIVVHLLEVPWANEISPREYCAVGDVLDVKILFITDDGEAARGWLPWPDGREDGRPHDPPEDRPPDGREGGRADDRADDRPT
ncbi:MAG: hypothetical protein KF878_11995 [Planctomycetes bacterium]|nr:hypothetical protein [Planctomycetota bacterium]